MLDLWCCAGAFSSSASVGYSLVAELGLFIAGASLVAPGLWGARASELWHRGSAALQHVESSRTRDGT